MDLNCRRGSELSAKARLCNLIFHCKNQPIYTQVHWKIPKIMYVVLRTGYYAIDCLAFRVVEAWLSVILPSNAAIVIPG